MRDRQVGICGTSRFDRIGSNVKQEAKRYGTTLELPQKRNEAANLNADYHFTCTGKEEKPATVTFRDGALQVQDGHQGEANRRVTADSETWLGFLAQERSLLWALVRRAHPSAKRSVACSRESQCLPGIRRRKRTRRISIMGEGLSEGLTTSRKGGRFHAAAMQWDHGICWRDSRCKRC